MSYFKYQKHRERKKVSKGQKPNISDLLASMIPLRLRFALIVDSLILRPC